MVCVRDPLCFLAELASTVKVNWDFFFAIPPVWIDTVYSGWCYCSAVLSSALVVVTFQ